MSREEALVKSKDFRGAKRPLRKRSKLVKATNA
jgi:hypothetical protein